MMNITINGKNEDVKEGSTVLDVLRSKDVNPQLVACELNLTIVRRARLGETTLKEGDTLEILQMIGGG